MTSIVSLGSINADFQLRVDDSPVDVPLLFGRDLLRSSGGKGSNVAVFGRRLGTETHLLGCVGDDDLADQALAGPRSEGVGLDGVRRVPGPTGFTAILVPPSGDKRIVLALNANTGWADYSDDVGHELTVVPPGAVLVTDFEVPAAVVRAAIGAARRRDMTIVLDPSPPDHIPGDLLSEIGHITPNADEARQMTGIDATTDDGAMAAARALVARGPAVSYVKLPAGGCAVASRTIRELIPAPTDIDVIDATGAGDAFAGALAWALLAGRSPADAAAVAVAGATCAITRYGSQPSYPTMDELMAMTARVERLR